MLIITSLSAFSLQITGVDIPEERLTSIQKYIQDDSMPAVYTSDYDNDGSKEAFVLIGELEEGGCFESTYKAELWFVSESETVRLEEEKVYSVNNSIVRFGECNLFVLTESYTSMNLVNIWGVKDGKPYKHTISGHGGNFEYQNSQWITLTHSTYDASYSINIPSDGHTWKKYYFYFDEKEQTFHEYGGVRITEEQLLNCDGAREITNLIKEREYNIDDIFYRANGLIQINYSHHSAEGDISYHNTTLMLKDGRVSFLTDGCTDDMLNASDQYGVYQDAMIPEIAVYPDELPEVFTSDKTDGISTAEITVPTVYLLVFIIFLLLVIALSELFVIINILNKKSKNNK